MSFVYVVQYPDGVYCTKLRETKIEYLVDKREIEREGGDILAVVEPTLEFEVAAMELCDLLIKGKVTAEGLSAKVKALSSK
jgi:hypothetical protein